jgi:hypothetical protein
MKESLVYGLFGGLIGSLYMGWIYSPKPPSLAVVDMQTLVSLKSRQLAKTLAETRMSETQRVSETLESGTLLSETQEAGERLKEGLKAFALTHNLILLAKGATMGGNLPDKTEEILALIDKGDF